MTEPKCETCKHRRPCKVLINKRWVHFYICDVLLTEEGGEALVVTDEECCEMHTERKEQSDDA